MKNSGGIAVIIVLVIIMIIFLRGRRRHESIVPGEDPNQTLLQQMAGADKMFEHVEQPGSYITIIPVNGKYHVLSFGLRDGEPSNPLPVLDMVSRSRDDAFVLATEPDSPFPATFNFQASPPYITSTSVISGFPGGPTEITQRLKPEPIENPLSQEYITSVIDFASQSLRAMNGANGTMNGANGIMNGANGTMNGANGTMNGDINGTMNGANGISPTVANGAPPAEARTARTPALFGDKQCSII